MSDAGGEEGDGTSVERKESKVDENDTKLVEDDIPTKETNQDSELSIEEREDEKTTTAAGLRRTNSVRERIGSMLESSSVQCGVLYLLIVEIVAAVFALLIDANADLGYPKRYHAVARPVLDVVLMTITVASTLELICLVVIFHVKLLSHIGYIIDVGVVGIILWHSTVTNTSNPLVHLIALSRFWRLLRIYMTDLARERRNSLDSEAKVIRLESEINILRQEKTLAEKAAAKESQARKSVEAMMNEYKERLDQYGEALRIAAVTVARAQETEGGSREKDRDAKAGSDDGNSVKFSNERIVVSESGAYEVKAKKTLRRRRAPRNDTDGK